MNKILKFIFLLFLQNLFAQVGIKTINPQRILHVEGGLRVRNLAEKGTDSDYNKILAVNPSGNIDYINKSELLPSTSINNTGKNVYNVTYTSPTGLPDETHAVKCGKFMFSYRINDSSAYVRVKLADAPTDNVYVYDNFVQKFDIGGIGFQYEASPTPLIMTSANNYIDVTVGSGYSQSFIADQEYNVLYINYPQDVDLYKVSFYRVKVSSTTQRKWAIACEKY